jgi:hypothetical protein
MSADKEHKDEAGRRFDEGRSAGRRPHKTMKPLHAVIVTVIVAFALDTLQRYVFSFTTGTSFLAAWDLIQWMLRATPAFLCGYLVGRRGFICGALVGYIVIVVGLLIQLITHRVMPPVGPLLMVCASAVPLAIFSGFAGWLGELLRKNRALKRLQADLDEGVAPR